MSRPRLLRVFALTVLLSLLVTGCVGGYPEVDVSVESPELELSSAPEDNGSIRTGMAEILSDLAVLEPAVEPLIADMIESELILGREIRAGDAVSEAEIDGGGTSRGADGFDTFGASMVLVGNLAALGLSATMSAESTRGLGVSGSSSVNGSGSKASSVSEGGRTVERTGDNEVSLTLEQSSESTKDGVTVRSSNSVKIEGTVCPSDDGQFDFTITVFSDAAGGPGEGTAAAMQTMIVRVTGALDDDGFPGEITVDGHQATRHTKADGSAVYVETESTSTGNIISTAGAIQATKPRLVKKSENATDADVKQLAKLGADRMSYLALGVISGVQTTMWNNGCVRINATSPGTVAPRSATDIPVTTQSRLSQEEFSSRVSVRLSGPEKVDKEGLRTPESVTYTAGGAGTKATITLQAKSRRGTADLTLAISTGSGAYFAAGGGGSFYGEGTICDLAKPFTISGSGVVVQFAPAGSNGGSYSYQGNMGGVTVYGGESYEVDYDGEVATGIRGWGLGTVETGGHSATGFGEEHYVLTPLEGSQQECG